MTQPNATREGQKTALTECEAAFKKSNKAGEHPANAEAWRAFRAGWHGRAAVSETRATWIPCSEREPREDEYPVVCISWDGETFSASSHASLTCYSAKYWMPLPEGPK